MKCSELQVKSDEKDVHIKYLKDKLIEAEDKLTKLQKVHIIHIYVLVCVYMCVQ